MNEAAPWYAPWLGPEGISVPGWGGVAAAATSAAVVLLVVPGLRRFAWLTGFLDHPEARKLHTQATPLLGGVAVALGVLIGVTVGLWVGRLPLPERQQARHLLSHRRRACRRAAPLAPPGQRAPRPLLEPLIPTELPRPPQLLRERPIFL